MASQDKLFLTASVESSNALTELFDFVWPTAVALWNLQWQTKGFLAQRPNATVNELSSRFVLGSDIHGANLTRLATEKAWPEMQQWFAKLLLSETCALFEGWIEAGLDELDLPSAIRQKDTRNALDKKLQFPTTFDNANAPTGGARFAVSQVRGAVGSPTIQACFHPTQIQNKKYATQTLDQLLICYRAFKEVRNDFIHHGGCASVRTEQAFMAFSALTNIELGIKEAPELPPVVAGKPIRLSIRGIVGLSDVVLRLIATFDCLLVDSPYGEDVLKRRWLGKHNGLVTVKPAGHSRDIQLTGLIKQCGLPKPVATVILYNYLNSQRLAV